MIDKFYKHSNIYKKYRNIKIESIEKGAIP